VTGASKGVGRATAISYAKAGAAQIAIGARSSLTSLESEILAAAKSAGKPVPKILALKLDVESHESVKDAAKAVQEEFGRLDILINNAGYLEPAVLVGESDPIEYWKVWEVNYHGVYYVTREFLPLLLNTEGGLKTIVNVSSMGATSLRPGHSGYQTSKFAILKFTEFLCAEYAQKGLVAFAVHPGGVATELALRIPEYMRSCKSFHCHWLRRLSN
jgi:NAD(P)-dependent dehydrogenase (short-subunit alcohol dehydrogenase family)